MNERRVSLGNRALSLLLALVMVIGMLPLSVFSVFAADTTVALPDELETTVSNAGKVQSFADQMRLENIMDDYSNGGFTWETESSSKSWRYYNGVMINSMLMVGGDEIENYARDFYNDNLDSSNKPVGYTSNEVDSVPMALGMFDLLDTADAAKYKTAIAEVFKKLTSQELASGCGGNYRHKVKSDGAWATWLFALDGLYMADIFETECAIALKNGKLESLTANNGTVYTKDNYTTLLTNVYNRFIWVADTMQDPTTKLYHHGWNGSNGNGVFWGRGIGWYAVALVEVIDLMPADLTVDGKNCRQELINRLPKLFDGMMAYQQDGGMWYNVIATTSKTNTEGSNGISNNKLEVSVTSMMAYAMMKAYNEGWMALAADKGNIEKAYGQAGLDAFNAVSAKMTGTKGNYTITDIYRSASVYDSESSYCSSSKYDSPKEAKGTGALIMASTEAVETATKLNGASVNTYTSNGVSVTTGSGSSLTVVQVTANSTVSNAVKGQFSDYVAYDIVVEGFTQGSEAVVAMPIPAGYSYSEVKVYYVDDSGNSTLQEGSVQNGCFVFTTDHFSTWVMGVADWDLTEGTKEEVAWETATTDGSDQYLRITLSELDASYLGKPVVIGFNKDGKNTLGVNGTSLAASQITVSQKDGLYYSFASAPVEWYITKNTDGSYLIYTEINSKTYYLTSSISGTSGTISLANVDDAANASTWDILVYSSSNTDAVRIYKVDGSNYFHINNNGSTVTLNRKSDNTGSADAIRGYLYAVIPASAGTTQTPTKWARLDTVDFALTEGDIDADDIIGQIANVCELYTSEDEAFTNPTRITDWTGGSATSGVYYTWDTQYADAEGEYNLTVKYNGVELGKVKVTVAEKAECSHSYTSEVTTAATCKNTGVETFTCSLCGDTYTKSIPVLDHTVVTDAAVAATCTSTGLTAGSHCSACGTVITAQTVIPMTDHTYANGTCSVCGAADPNATTQTNLYEIVTSATSLQQYVICENAYFLNHSAGKTEITWTQKDGKYEDTNKVAQLWTFESTGDSDGSFYIYYTEGNTNHYLICTTSSNNPTTSTTASTKWLVQANGSSNIYLKTTVATGNSSTKREDLGIDGDGPKLESKEQSLTLYAPVISGSTDPDEPDTYTVEFENTSRLEGDTFNLADAVTVKKNGETITTGYTLSFSGTGVSGSTFTAPSVDADKGYAITVKVTVDGEEVATTTGTMTSVNVAASISGADSVTAGNTATYTVDLTPDATKKVQWSIESGSEYATIDSASGVLTANNAGTVVIKATVSEIGGSAVSTTATKTVTVEASSVTPPVTGGTWTHIFDEHGMDSTEFYTFTTDSDSLATKYGSVTFEGETYSKALKMNSKGSAVFTTEGAGSLTLVSKSEKGGLSLVVSGSDGTTVVVPEGTATIPVNAGVTYTVKRYNSGELGLFYISYAEAASDAEITSGELATNATQVEQNGTVDLSALKLKLYSEGGVLLDTVDLTNSNVTFGDNKQSFTDVVNTANPGEYSVKVWYGDIDCGTLTVKVNETQVDASQYALTVSPSEITIDLSSGTTTGSITASVTKDGAAASDCTITYASDNESVAKVGTDGTVTGIAAGSTDITVTAKVGSTVVATATVKVTVTGSTSSGGTDTPDDGEVTVESFNDAQIYKSMKYELFTGAPSTLNDDDVLVIVDASGKYAFTNPDADDDNANAKGTEIKDEGNNVISVSENQDFVEWTLSKVSTSSSQRKARFGNNNRHIYFSDSNSLNGGGSDIYIIASDVDNGKYYLRSGASSGKYIVYDQSNDKWGRQDAQSIVYLYKKTLETENVNITFGVTESMTLGIDAEGKTPFYIVTLEGTTYPVDGTNTVVELTVTNGDSYAKIENGQIVGVKEGSATVTATLVKVNGKEVTSTVTDTIAVTVQDVPTVYSLSQGTLHVRKNGTVNVKDIIIYANGEPSATSYFNMAGAYIEGDPNGKKGVTTDLDMLNITSDTVTFMVPVIDSKKGEQVNAADGTPLYLKVIVHNDEFYGLGDPVTENPPEGVAPLPEYPQAGGVRIDKTAEGINFSQTGIAKVELDVAGVAKESNIDVILIVDVSNSMGWSMNWWNLNYEYSNTHADTKKIPQRIDGDTTYVFCLKEAEGSLKSESTMDATKAQKDKLDMAMEYATQFANILLGSNTGNTLSFVTFASGSAKSDMVVYTGRDYDDLASVQSSFSNTRFTQYQYDDSKIKYTLQINGGSGFTNSGGTNYDSAFESAQAAITQLQTQYAENNNGKSYAESGREIRVVFMTDGAPSHYNSPDGDDNVQGQGDGEAQMNFLQNHYHNGATALFTNPSNCVTKMYAVGFDLAHGGYSGFKYTAADLEDQLIEVVGGMVANELVETTLATNEGALQRFFYDLGRGLAYAGTEAYVEDTIHSDFNLITNAIDLNADGVNDDNRIELGFYKLYTAADVGTTGYRLNKDGVVENFAVTANEIGLRRMNSDGSYDYTPVETVYLNGVDTNGTYSVKSLVLDSTTNTIIETWTAGAANRVYYYDYGTSVLIDGYYFDYHNDGTKEWFDWDIGEITDAEIVLTYYERLAEEGVDGKIYDTNEAAYLDYVTIYERHAHLTFPVPQLAYGKATVNVRFYLVNEQGEFTNRAGAVFEEAANRVFLPNTYSYSQGYCSTFNGSVAKAMIDANLNNAIAYDGAATFTVTNTVEDPDGKTGSSTVTGTKDNINDLLLIVGSGDYHQVTVEIPVILTDLGSSDQRMATVTNVIDYSKPVEINVFTDAEKQYLQGYVVGNEKYDATVEGFAVFNESFDQTHYVPESYASATLSTENGTYAIADKSGTIRFTPKGIFDGTERVFIGIKFSKSERADENSDFVATKDYYFMLKEVNIVPATVMHYETVGDMQGAFTMSGSWSAVTEQGAVTDENQNAYASGDVYGKDSSYASDRYSSNGTALKATGEGVLMTTVNFSFTGTGFDIISRTGANQGQIRVSIYSDAAKENLVKTILVLNKGENELYQVPVVSAELESWGTYYVEIGVYGERTSPAILARGNEFYFDALVVYNTAAQADTIAQNAYKVDGEYAPVITEIRDQLIDAGKFNEIDITDSAYTGNGMIFVDKNSENTNQVATYASVGPNNEVYLTNGQGIAFQIHATATPASIDIGAKSADGRPVTMKAMIVSGNNSKTITEQIGTSTAMFYSLGDVAGYFPNGGDAYVVVINTSDGILSLTDMKVAYAGTNGITLARYNVTAARYASQLLNASSEETKPEATLNKGDDGNWYYFVGNEVDTSFTGLVEYSNGTWYVLDGQIVFNYDGAITFQGETYYIKAGRVSETTTGLYKYTGEWMYYTSGKVDTAYTGLAERSGMTVYVANGAVDFTKTGAVSHNGKLYYVRYGVVDSSFTGLVRADDGAWVYVTAGQQDTAYTGIVAHNGSNWYVENGAVNFQFTGTVADANGNWTVNRGQATAVNN